jgi:hypothetical protein
LAASRPKLQAGLPCRPAIARRPSADFQLDGGATHAM